MTSCLIYDLEIIKAVPSDREPTIPGIAYCGGWNDHAGMGVSCIGAYDYVEDRYRVFCADDFDEFKALCEKRELLVGFNNIPFDNEVLKHLDLCTGIEPARFYDLLREIWAADGLGPVFTYPRHAGYGLDAVCRANFGLSKTGNGALAPVLWQQGKIGQVIDYCLQDIRLTKRLFDEVIARRAIKSPKNGMPLTLRFPFEVPKE